MEFISGKRNEDVYTISFWSSFGWMFLGPMLYLIAFAILYGQKYGYDFLVDIVNGHDNLNFMSGLVITELLSKVLPMGLIIYIFKKMFINDFIKFKQKWIKFILIIIISYVVLLLTNYLLSWIYDILRIKGSSANQQYIEYIFASRYKYIMIMIAVVIAPIFEELIFRKFLISYLKGKTKLNNFWIYFISAAVFAGIHIISNPADIIFFPLYFSLSVIITLAYKITDDNLYVSSGIHFFNNLISFLAV